MGAPSGWKREPPDMDGNSKWTRWTYRRSCLRSEAVHAKCLLLQASPWDARIFFCASSSGTEVAGLLSIFPWEFCFSQLASFRHSLPVPCLSFLNVPCDKVKKRKKLLGSA